MEECPLSSRQIAFLVIDRWWSVMLSIAVLTNEVCTVWSDPFLVLARNGPQFGYV